MLTFGLSRTLTPTTATAATATTTTVLDSPSSHYSICPIIIAPKKTRSGPLHAHPRHSLPARPGSLPANFPKPLPFQSSLCTSVIQPPAICSSLPCPASASAALRERRERQLNFTNLKPPSYPLNFHHHHHHSSSSSSTSSSSIPIIYCSRNLHSTHSATTRKPYIYIYTYTHIPIVTVASS